MTALLYLSILLASTVTATTYRKNYRNSFDSGESYSSFGNGYFGDETSSRTGPSKREFNGSPYDADDYIPPKIGIKHNNDYSALGDGYQEYAGTGGSGGNGAISYSQVVSEHRPVQRYNPSSQSSQYSSQSSSTFGSPPSPNYRGLTAEGTNVVEKPAVPGLYKWPRSSRQSNIRSSSSDHSPIWHLKERPFSRDTISRDIISRDTISRGLISKASTNKGLTSSWPQ